MIQAWAADDRGIYDRLARVMKLHIAAYQWKHGELYVLGPLAATLLTTWGILGRNVGSSGGGSRAPRRPRGGRSDHRVPH